jgi:uncharacterized membrane protein
MPPPMPEKLLFLGEGPRGAGYLEGVLTGAYAMERVYADQPLDDRDLGQYPVFVLSDYPSRQLSVEQQAKLVDAVEHGGAGLVMIGGWASFGGPRGSWRGTRLSELLPVEIASDDDRTNTPLGTVLIATRQAHPAVRTIQRAESCVVCGFNAVRPRREARTLIEGFALSVRRAPAAQLTVAAAMSGARTRQLANPLGMRPQLNKHVTPMLSVWEWGRGRVAAFAPDVSPHWAGGIVDWGTAAAPAAEGAARRAREGSPAGNDRIVLPNGAEIGHLYRAFLLDLCAWLEGK